MSQGFDPAPGRPADGRPTGGEPVAAEIEARLTRLLMHHDAIASTLSQASAQFVGRRRKHAAALGRFFAQQHSAQQVLRRADAMAVCAPLLRQQIDRPSAIQIEDAVNEGLNRIDELQTDAGQWRVFLVYPMVVTALAIVIALGYLFFLVPIFDEMFQEFGIQLSGTSQVVVECSHLVTRYWPAFASLLATLAIGAAAALIAVSRKERPVWLGPFRYLCESRQQRLLQGTSHLAFLCESGLPITQSLRIVASANDHTWAAGWWARWASQLDSGQPIQSTAIMNSIPGSRLLVLAGHQCQSETQNTDLGVDLLRTAGAIHRDRLRYHHDWLLAWTAPIVLFTAALCIGMLVVALLSPMVSLIQSLSS